MYTGKRYNFYYDSLQFDMYLCFLIDCIFSFSIFAIFCPFALLCFELGKVYQNLLLYMYISLFLIAASIQSAF